jgi:hypothetical protein
MSEPMSAVGGEADLAIFRVHALANRSPATLQRHALGAVRGDRRSHTLRVVRSDFGLATPVAFALDGDFRAPSDGAVARANLDPVPGTQSKDSD